MYGNDNFAKYAGQLVKDGIRTNEPYIALESSIDKTAYGNLAAINGLMPKIGRIIIRDTMVTQNPLDPIINNYDMPYGVAVEEGIFMTGAPNKKDNGRCHPRGNVDMASNLYVSNFDTNITITIKDREVNKAVFGAEDVERYTAQKMRTQLKTYEQMRKSAWIQLVSDVIDGERSIASKTESQDYGTEDGTDIDYEPANIKGYAGYVATATDVGMSGTVSPVEAKKLVGVTVADTLAYLEYMEGLVADMKEESTDFNLVGAETFIGGMPNIIMETKTLNAMDNVLIGQVATTGSGLGINPARAKLREFGNLIEIGSFAGLPTNESYENMRLGAVVIGDDALMNFNEYYSIEASRCVQDRSTSWNLQAENLFAISKAVPSSAILFDVPTEDEDEDENQEES